MPLVFTKSEIRQQLNDIGFFPDEDKLKSFIRDLKRLIKAEEKKRRERKAAAAAENNDENGYPSPSTHTDSAEHTSTTATTYESLISSSGTDHVDIAPPRSHVNVKSLDPNRVKEMAQSNLATDKAQESRQVLGDKTNNRSQKLPENVGLPPKSVSKPPRSKGATDKKTVEHPNAQDKVSVPPAAASVPGRKHSSASSTATTTTTTASTYSSSFEIDFDLSSCNDSDEGYMRPRVRLPPESVRHDPVSLYHFYKSFWDRQKVPGEDPRTKLRWNVRAGTLGKIPCYNNGVPTKYLR